ncbi:MAG: alpha/beta hydrolase family protein [Patescibacteria group bacterium]
MQKIFITNRNNKKLAVVVEKSEDQKGLAFVMHGLGDSKDSLHIRAFAGCFFDNNYTVITFDAANTYGESEGTFQEANITNYYEDFVDVINWSKEQDFYQEPFVLCGHSLGATASVFYAENYPEEVKALAPFSSVVNANLAKEEYTADQLLDWEKTGWLTEDWGWKEPIRLKWSYMKEKEKYDLLIDADKLTMPTFIAVGELDNCTPFKHQKILFDKLPCQKEIHIIKGSPHTFRDKNKLQEIKELLSKWIRSL